MASLVACRSLALVLAIVVAASVTSSAAGSCKSLNITNNCAHTVWPAITSGPSSAAVSDTTGFELAPGQWEIVSVPSGWSGRVWGRTLCSTDTAMGKFSCLTGDCGTGRQDCAGGNAARPVTLAQLTLDGSGGGMDLYDVSLVDGFNLPMMVVPPQSSSCAPTGCVADLNVACPAELRAGAVACKSACQAFGSPQYCCTGAYGNPNTCKPSAYSKVFKMACPRAVSYAYDGGAIFTCGGGDDTGGGTYTITFCPASATSRGYTTPPPPPGTGNLKQPLINGSTSTASTGNSAVSQPSRIALIVGVLSVVTAALGVVTAVVVLYKTCGAQDR